MNFSSPSKYPDDPEELKDNPTQKLELVKKQFPNIDPSGPFRIEKFVGSNEEYNRLKAWTTENMDSIVETLQLSPGYIQKTLRMTTEEREEYLKELKTYSFDNIAELFNKDWKDASVHYLIWMSKAQSTIEKLGLTEEQRATAFYDFEFSEGNESLEWCWPSPPPEHTYEELPIIKEVPTD